ncbi:hypothetical protein HDK90DRAFT_275345 [Phyllosticta capitalensis]|uniref:Uncharacterized protein n=1 Tax=Phyllosticta capitalensis TaxID=121624 RepID=A0ABR1YNE6_9PEZI
MPPLLLLLPTSPLACFSANLLRGLLEGVCRSVADRSSRQLFCSCCRHGDWLDCARFVVSAWRDLLILCLFVCATAFQGKPSSSLRGFVNAPFSNFSSRRWSGNGKSAVSRQQESVSDTKRNCYALTTAGEYKSARHYKQRQAQRRQPQEQQRPSPTPPTLASASLNIKVTSINAAQLDPSAARHKWRGDPPPSDSIQAPNGSPVGGRGGG